MNFISSLAYYLVLILPKLIMVLAFITVIFGLYLYVSREKKSSSNLNLMVYADCFGVFVKKTDLKKIYLMIRLLIDSLILYVLIFLCFFIWYHFHGSLEEFPTSDDIAQEKTGTAVLIGLLTIIEFILLLIYWKIKRTFKSCLNNLPN